MLALDMVLWIERVWPSSAIPARDPGSQIPRRNRDKNAERWSAFEPCASIFGRGFERPPKGGASMGPNFVRLRARCGHFVANEALWPLIWTTAGLAEACAVGSRFPFGGPVSVRSSEGHTRSGLTAAPGRPHPPIDTRARTKVAPNIAPSAPLRASSPPPDRAAPCCGWTERRRRAILVSWRSRLGHWLRVWN